MFIKDVKNGYVVAIGTGIVGEEITETEYENILSAVVNKPKTPEGYEYFLIDGTLEWDLVEAQPEPEQDPSPEEALEILLGGAL